MFNKYTINQIVLFSNLLIFLGVQYWLVLQTNLFGWFTLPAFVIIAVNLHYFLNALHLATHHLISTNKFLNSILGRISAILGGLTFAEFSKTHIQHHKYPGDKEKDPDFILTKSGNLLALPFKVWMKDKYFWQSDLSKQESFRRMYIQDRAIQTLILLSFILAGKINVFLVYWSVPALIVGLSYGFYLFYFPHYISKWEDSERLKISSDSKNYFNQAILWTIDLARFYHTQHHFKIQENINYYPVVAYSKDFFRKTLSPKFSTERTFTKKASGSSNI